MAGESVNLPPGFRFSPTDEELVLHFLYRKASLLPCHPNIIPDLDLSLFHPSQLNGKALSSGNQFYFFTKVKENRVTESGYWKEIGFTESIVSAAVNKVGMKKYFIFNNGEAAEGTETNWVMQEYHLWSSQVRREPLNCARKDQKQSKWVLCRVYERNGDDQQGEIWDDDDDGTELSWADEVFMSLDDDIEEISFPNLDFIDAQ